MTLKKILQYILGEKFNLNEIKMKKIVDLLDKRTDSKSFNLNWEAFHVIISKYN